MFFNRYRLNFTSTKVCLTLTETNFIFRDMYGGLRTMAHVAFWHWISILTAQLKEDFSHIVTQMITDFFFFFLLYSWYLDN